MIKVSVIIPVYNVGKYIQQTVLSCLNQTLHEIEIIAINDGSKDDSGKILDQLSKLDSRILVLHQENAGVTKARNAGIAVATGEYIFLLDGDDYLEKDALKQMYLAAKKNNADYVVGDFLIDYGNRKVERKFYDFCIVDNIGFLKYSFANGDFYYTGRLYRKRFYDAIAFDVPADITFGEDNLAVEQLAFHVGKAVKINAFVLNYVQRNESVTNRLSVYDLQKRAKACNYLIELTKKQSVFEYIKDEVTLWALREIDASVRRGFVDKNFAKQFLSFRTISLCKHKLTLVQRVILYSANISLPMTMFIINMIRRKK